MFPDFFARKNSARLRGAVVLSLLLVTLWLSSGVAQAAAVATGTNFTDYLGSFDTSRFSASGAWANGSPFINGWLPDHISFVNGNMKLKFDKTPSSGMAYSSGEYRTRDFYGYGCYESRFKPNNISGVVSSFFTYTGMYDKAPGATGQHDEIDVEFVGKNTNQIQLGFYAKDGASGVNHSHPVNLSFDASAAMHNYAFKWTAQGIVWYVDGVEVYRVNNNTADPTPNSAEATQRIMTNLWAVDGTPGTKEWAGTFTYPGRAITVSYSWIKYTAGTTCIPTKKVTAPA